MTEVTTDYIPITRAQLDEYRRTLNAERQHVTIAHAKILQQRDELRTLNDVIRRRRRTITRLRSYVDAVKKLHRPVIVDADTEHAFTVCAECCTDVDGNQSEYCADYHLGEPPCWPCQTQRALVVTGEAQ